MKKYFVIGIFIFIQAIGGTIKADALPNLIGTHYSKYPDNTCTNYEGYVSTQNDNYIITSALCNKNYVIWLSKRINNKENDKTSSQDFVLLDQINVRALKKGESFSSGPYCYKKDKAIEWAAIYNWNGKNKATRKNNGISNAWVANFNTEKFEVAPIELLDSAYCSTEEE